MNESSLLGNGRSPPSIISETNPGTSGGRLSFPLAFAALGGGEGEEHPTTISKRSIANAETSVRGDHPTPSPENPNSDRIPIGFGSSHRSTVIQALLH
jgi:hypothetical protein